MICQHLDDICSAAAEKEVLEKFDEAFITVAAELGVKLAPRDDHDKMFGPCRKGSGLRGGVRHGGVDVAAAGGEEGEDSHGHQDGIGE